MNTVRSYRDTFSLLLLYCRDERQLPSHKLTLEQIDRHLVEGFLQWLETSRGCSAGTHFLERCQKILSIPHKKTQKKVMSYLTLDEIQVLLAQPNANTPAGRRDLTMLSLLYDTGARVQELADLTFGDIRLSSPTVIRLTGKGGKARLVPIMTPTEKLLRAYLEEHDPNYSAHGGYPLFCNRNGKKLTRAGIAYILNKHVRQAQTLGSISPQTVVSPHVLRHSKAMHLLQSGVNLVYIRDLLGHADVSTTEIYARADERFKREALMQAYPSPTPEPETTAWQKNSDLMDGLKSLGK